MSRRALLLAIGIPAALTLACAIGIEVAMHITARTHFHVRL